MNINKPSFTEYMLEFYGDNGIYPYGFTVAQIWEGMSMYVKQLHQRNQQFEGDSVDREYVRDIILAKFYPEELV